MSDVIYVSKVRIERFGGGHRRAHLPVGEAADFGVHDEIAEHYGMTPGQFEPHAATLDYVVAAAGGWLTGTLGGALEARGVPARDGKLVADVTGEVEKTEDGVIVLRRVHVKYVLRADPEVLADRDKRAAIDRAEGLHVRTCPVARSIGGSVDITTELELVPNE